MKPLNHSASKTEAARPARRLLFWVAGLAALFLLQACATASTTSVPALTVKSSIFKDGQRLSDDQVANTFGCSGKNISPDLQWSGAPEQTKFYAVTLYDPDAPTGSGFWHWVVFNIPASVTSLNAGAGRAPASLPPGSIMVKHDGGARSFLGACPPPGHGEHRYILTVYALKDRLPLDASASPAMVGFMIHQMKLAEGSITATYSR